MLGAFLALACPYAIPAHAEAPTPDQLIRLDDRVMRTSRVRITMLSGAVVAEGVRVSADGLAYRDILQPTGGGTPPIPARIPWDAVVRVDVPGNHWFRAALGTALVVGITAGVAHYAAGKRGEEGGPGGIIVVPPAILLAAGVGALIPAWHPIYRTRRASAGRR